MKAPMLSDEEIIQLIKSDKNRKVGWTVTVTPRDRKIAEAQRDADVKWYKGNNYFIGY